jgi:hypothetical protein
MKFLNLNYSSKETAGRYRIDADRRMRIEEYRGKTDLVDLKSIFASMASDPGWSPDFHGLVDFSDAELDLSSNDVLRLSLMLRQLENRTWGWLAYVATNSTNYGLVRMLGYWSRISNRLRIFESRPEAEAWLVSNRNRMPPRFINDGFAELGGAMLNAG